MEQSSSRTLSRAAIGGILLFCAVVAIVALVPFSSRKLSRATLSDAELEAAVRSYNAAPAGGAPTAGAPCPICPQQQQQQQNTKSDATASSNPDPPLPQKACPPCPKCAADPAPSARCVGGKEKQYKSFFDPHPSDPAINGTSPRFRGPERDLVQGKWPLCGFFTNVSDMEAAMREDPSYVAPIPPFRHRNELVNILECEGKKIGVELGVQRGVLSRYYLERWKSNTEYHLVDLWQKQQNYFDAANVDNDAQNLNLAETLKNTAMWKDQVRLCRNYTNVCAARLRARGRFSYFDFIYVDARHDRLGVLDDLQNWWPLLKRGGLMCGHDFLVASDMGDAGWAVNYDGSVDQSGMIILGAVIDFFQSHASRNTDHHRQVTATIREPNAFATWCVRK